MQWETSVSHSTCLIFMKPLLKAERYTHGVRITGYNRDTQDKLFGYLESLKLKEPKKLPGNRMIMELKKKYFGMTEDGREIFIHRNCYDDMVGYLANKNIPSSCIEVVDIPVPNGDAVKLELLPMYVLRDYQEIIKADILRPHLHSARIDLYTGYGKATSNNTPIKVPGGWKMMGDIVVGDKVIGQDGKQTDVIGVYPQGKLPLYRMTFRDGRTIDTCGEHLWKVYQTNASTGKNWKIVNTKEILRMISLSDPRVYIPLCESEESVEVDLPISPYTLGALLGDGHLGNGSLTLTSADQEIFDRVENELPDTLTFSQASKVITKRIVRKDNSVGKNVYIVALRELGLLPSVANSKFIPEQYLNSSTKQRWDLLKGLMDTDGFASMLTDKCKSGSTSYTTVSFRLAKDVQYLVRSLGGIASITMKTPRYEYNGEQLIGQDAYTVNIRIKTPTKLFNLKRKQERVSDDNQYAATLKLQVMKVEGIGSYEATCISVNNEDKLFVAKDFIVTHNTLTSLASAVDFGERVLVMVPPKYFGIWSEALEKTYKDIGQRWITVSGSAELQKLIDRGLEKDLEDIDVIIMSSISYRSYIENYEKYGEKIDEIGYNAPPPRFHEACGIGLQINDEIQEDPGLLFRIDIFSNVKKQIYLSATPFTGNAFVTKMIDKQLPESTQCRLPNYEVFINCLGLLYTEPKIKPQDYLTPFKNTYNHARYETVMMKNPKRKLQYFNMVGRIAEGVFAKTRIPGQKLLILCATVAFIDDLVVYLKEKYPDLQVNGHVSGSPYERLLKNDITVSTIKSSGTGVDIPDLRELILLQATGSKKDAIQILGRLRKLKSFPDVTPKLTCMCCTSIPQHNRYLEMHKENFAGRTLNFKIMTVGM